MIYLSSISSGGLRLNRLTQAFALLAVCLLLVYCTFDRRSSKTDESFLDGTTLSDADNKAKPTAPEQNQFVGYDLDGQKRACPAPDEDMLCTMVFTPADEFANQCSELGHEVFTCGCHDHLCSENINAM